MSIKNISRLRRAKKSRSNIRNQVSPRLTVYRSSQHFYAQIFDSLGSRVMVSASTLEKDFNLKSCPNTITDTNNNKIKEENFMQLI